MAGQYIVPSEEADKEFMRANGLLAPIQEGVIKEAAKGFASGVTQTVAGAASTLQEVAGINGPADAMTEFQKSHQQWNPPPEYEVASLNPANLARTIGQGVGTSVGALGAGVTATALTGGNPLAGGAAVFASTLATIHGDEVKEMRKLLPDADESTVQGLGLLSSVGQSLFESVIGPERMAPALVKNIVRGALKDTGRSMGKTVLLNAAKGGLEEGSEEVMQLYWSNIVKKAGGAKIELPSWPEVRDNFIGGALPGGVMGGGLGVIEKGASGNKTETLNANIPAENKIVSLDQAVAAVPSGLALENTPAMEAAKASTFDFSKSAKHWTPSAEVPDANMAASLAGLNIKPEEIKLAEPKSKATQVLSEVSQELTGQPTKYFMPLTENANAANGFVTPDGQLYINAHQTALNPAITTGHEFGHFIFKVEPENYGNFQKVLFDNVQANHTEYLDALTADYQKKGIDLTSEQAKNEFTNDVMGDFFIEPKFWQEVFAKPDDTGTLHKLAQSVIRFVDAITAKLQGNAKASKYVSDLQAVRNEAVKIVKGKLNPEKQTTEVVNGAEMQEAGQEKVIPVIEQPVAEVKTKTLTVSVEPPVAASIKSIEPASSIPSEPSIESIKSDAVRPELTAKNFPNAKKELLRQVDEAIKTAGDHTETINKAKEVNKKINNILDIKPEEKLSESRIAELETLRSEKKNILSGIPKAEFKVDGLPEYQIHNDRNSLEAFKKRISSQGNLLAKKKVTPIDDRKIADKIVKIKTVKIDAPLIKKVLEMFPDPKDSREVLRKPHYNPEFGEGVATDGKRVLVIKNKLAAPLEQKGDKPYPNYHQIIPADSTTQKLMDVDIARALEYLNQSMITIPEEGLNTVAMYVGNDGKLGLYSKSGTVGSFITDNVANGKFIADVGQQQLHDILTAAKLLGQDTVELRGADTFSPIVFNMPKADAIAVLMPYRQAYGDTPNESKDMPKRLAADRTDYSLNRQASPKTLEESAKDDKLGKYDLISSPDGKKYWGQITPEIAKQSKGKIEPGEIIMQKGVHLEAHRGFGATHIIEEHAKDFVRYGYNPDSYIHNILSSPDAIYSQGARYLLVKHGYPKGFSAIELRKIQGKDAYSVVTAFPEHPLNVKKINGVQVWRRTALDTSAISDQPHPLNRSADKSKSHPPLEELGPNNAVNNNDNTAPEKSQADFSLNRQANPFIAEETTVLNDRTQENYEPDKRTHAELDAEADRIIEAKGAAKLLADIAGKQLPLNNDLNMRLALKLLDSRAMVDAIRKGDVTAADAMVQWVQQGTEAGRLLAARKSEGAENGERDVMSILKGLLFAPSKRYRNEKDPAKKKEILKNTEKKIIDDAVTAINKRYDVNIFDMTEEQMNNPKLISGIAREIQIAKATVGDKAYEWWINGLLSLPKTHVANMVGNTAMAAGELIPQRFIEATVNLLARNKNAATFGEFRGMWNALKDNLMPAIKSAYQAFDLEQPITMADGSKLENIKAAIPDKWGGRYIRAPGRFLMAADEFAKALVIPIESNAYAYRMAHAEGLKGEAMTARIKELLSNGKSEAILWGKSRALELTFQQHPGIIATYLAAVKESNTVTGQVAKFLLPFIRTPANIVNTGVRKSPLGSLQLMAELIANRGRFNEQMVKHAAEQIMAWGAVAALWGMTGGDDDKDTMITGSNTARPGSGEANWNRQNHPATSIRIGGKWFDYSRIEPFGSSLAMAIDQIKAFKMAQNGEDGGKVAKLLMGSMAQNIKDKTFLQGVGDVMKSMDDGSYGVTVVSNFVSSWVPNVYRGTMNALDDNLKDNKSYAKGWEWFADQFTGRVATRAGLTGGVSKLDLWGRPIPADQGVGIPPMAWRIMSPIRTVDADLSKGDQLLYNYNQRNPNDEYYPLLPAPYYRKLNDTVFIKGAQYHEYAQVAGKMAAKDVESAIERGSLNYVNPTDKDIARLKQIFEKSRARARRETLK